MTTYTIAAHSGLGEQALEAYAVVSLADQRAILAAGGVLVGRYETAEDLATLGLRYEHPSAIAPDGVRGTFTPATYSGMRLWAPDPALTTLLRLSDECNGKIPLEQLLPVAEGIVAEAGA